MTLRQTMHVRVASDTQAIFDWSKWRWTLWRYVSPHLSQTLRHFRWSDTRIVDTSIYSYMSKNFIMKWHTCYSISIYHQLHGIQIYLPIIDVLRHKFKIKEQLYNSWTHLRKRFPHMTCTQCIHFLAASVKRV